MTSRVRGSLKPESTTSARNRTYPSACSATACSNAGTATAAEARRTVLAASERTAKSTGPSLSIAALTCAGVLPRLAWCDCLADSRSDDRSRPAEADDSCTGDCGETEDDGWRAHRSVNSLECELQVQCLVARERNRIDARVAGRAVGPLVRRHGLAQALEAQ